MTPAEIEVALWYYYSPGPFERSMAGFAGTIAMFIKEGLLKEHATPNEHGTSYSGTPRLKAYCESLCMVPLPESQWVTRWPTEDKARA